MTNHGTLAKTCIIGCGSNASQTAGNHIPQAVTLVLIPEPHLKNVPHTTVPLFLPFSVGDESRKGNSHSVIKVMKFSDSLPKIPAGNKERKY
jgi:hypothetical protein